MSHSIKIGDDFLIKSDRYCWALYTRYSTVSRKTGEPKNAWAVTYHPTFEKLAKKIVETEAKHVDTLEELVELMSQRVSDLEKSIAKVDTSKL